MSGTLLELDRTAVPAANLQVLRRTDPEIVRIVDTASHVAMYNFNSATNAWTKRNIEGALFVVERSTAPAYRLIVANRAAPSWLVQDICPTLEFQLKKPYLMFRDASQPELPTQAAWFHDEAELHRVITQLHALTASVKAAAAVSSSPSSGAATSAPTAPAPSASDPGRMILSALQPSASMAGSARAAEPAATVAPSSAPEAAPQGVYAGGDAAPVSHAHSSSAGSKGALQHAAATGGAGAVTNGSKAPAPEGDATAPRPAAPLAASESAASTGASAKPISSAPLAQALAPVSSALASAIGDIGIVLTRKQLAAVLTEALADDEFLDGIHRRYLEAVTRQALRR